jgi:UvrD-like helicase C-terminal domain
MQFGRQVTEAQIAAQWVPGGPGSALRSRHHPGALVWLRKVERSWIAPLGVGYRKADLAGARNSSIIAKLFGRNQAFTLLRAQHLPAAPGVAAHAVWPERTAFPQEIGVFVRSDAQLGRARNAVAAAKAEYAVLGEHMQATVGKVSISTMHLAKGLEFRGVAVMACDDEVLPFQERIESVTDESDLEEVYNTERHLLYVACTRARDRLLITGLAPTSEFLADMVVIDHDVAGTRERGVGRSGRRERLQRD